MDYFYEIKKAFFLTRPTKKSPNVFEFFEKVLNCHLSLHIFNHFFRRNVDYERKIIS